MTPVVRDKDRLHDQLAPGDRCPNMPTGDMRRVESARPHQIREDLHCLAMILIVSTGLLL